MTTVAFTPDVQSAFSFSATLDGNLCTVAARWNAYAQRWYITISTVAGDVVVTTPLIGSPPESPINLLAGTFTTSTMAFDGQAQTFAITP